jgi:hypothetical protein
VKQSFGLAITCAVLILCDAASATEKHKGGRTYKECRKLAIAEGIPIRDPKHYRGNYKALEDVELQTNPRGFIARCMAAKSHG